MDKSILEDVRSMCNLERTDNSFDNQLIPLINTQMMMAHQFGIGYDLYSVSSEDQTWDSWLGASAWALASVKTWLGYSVLLAFDPPDNGSVLKAYQEMVAKIEWMLREKSEEMGYVKEYVPEKADFYEDSEESADSEEQTEEEQSLDY